MSTDARKEPTAKALRTERMVQTALDIVSESGLEALTMRRLGDALGVKLPTIYRHFANKEALLHDMAEAVISNALAPTRKGDDWKARIVDLASDLRSALLGQRDGARIVGGSYVAKEHTLALAEAFVAAMRNAGFEGASALWATSTVYSYVLGECLEEQGPSAEGMDLLEHDTSAPLTYPHLFTTPIEQFVNFDARFTFGLQVLIVGLEGVRPR